MKPNPGGQIAPNEVLGRDALIASIWRILEGRSVYMNDLRRIGKTQIMVKMQAEAPAGWLTIKRDLGGFHTAAEFATHAYRDSERVLDTKKKSLRRMGALLGSLKGAEIAGILKLPDGSSAPWKEVLSRTFSDLDEQMTALGGQQRVLFLWDEVPFLLDNIVKREGPLVAMELLDLLRALGQDHDRVRLLLTGSIGLHHVLADLRAQGYINSPLNRMELVQPGPLSPPEALILAEKLLAHEYGATLDDPRECARAVADSVGWVPFYIHKLVTRLPRGGVLTPEVIDATLRREILSDNSDWDLKHYRDRLARYYGRDEKLALFVLDAVAVGGELDFSAIRKEVSARMSLDDDERIRSLLDLLCRDHYLVRTEHNRYRFYLALIQRWWRQSRSL